MVNSQRNAIIFGFDSAWTDSPKAPGAICAIAFDDVGRAKFHEPRLVSFSEACAFIDGMRRDFALSLVALDQPTRVPNITGMRPVEKVAASLVSFVGGGVQPANRGKVGMFCDEAPIWPFLAQLNAAENPHEARTAHSGHFLIEVFPALALPSLESRFAKRYGAPKYNPKLKKKFRLEDWQAVSCVVEEKADSYGLSDFAQWAVSMGSLPNPRKPDQDKLDAAVCMLIGLLWRSGPVADSAMLGDLKNGYMITPVSGETKDRLEKAAIRRSVAIS